MILQTSFMGVVGKMSVVGGGGMRKKNSADDGDNVGMGFYYPPSPSPYDGEQW